MRARVAPKEPPHAPFGMRQVLYEERGALGWADRVVVCVEYPAACKTLATHHLEYYTLLNAGRRVAKISARQLEISFLTRRKCNVQV